MITRDEIIKDLDSIIGRMDKMTVREIAMMYPGNVQEFFSYYSWLIDLVTFIQSK